MPQRQSIGGRIRERRGDLRLKQAELAQNVGISASYLNLIEHDRRRIGGKLLNDIARALTLEPAQLAEGAEDVLLDRLRTAAARLPESGAELARIDEFAARFPGWATLLADSSGRIAKLDALVAALTDRLGHDPRLSTSLHEVLSTVTAIRATSSILVNSDDIDRDWQGRFHRNIYEDSQRLTEASRVLSDYLQAPAQTGPVTLSPMEEAESFLTNLGFHVPALEGDTPEIEPAMAATGLRSRAAVAILTSHLERYRQDAEALPLATFGPAARAAAHDPVALADTFGVPFATVLRRLANLPSEAGHPDFGLAVCDGAGALTLVRESPGFALPRSGSACSLWPVFQALAQPGRPIRAYVSLPGQARQTLLCYAVAEQVGPATFDAPPIYRGVMLVVPVGGKAATIEPRPVGISCRICARPECAARREPSILTESIAPLPAR